MNDADPRAAVRADPVAVVRSVYEVMDSDLPATLELISEEVELINPSDAVEAGTRYGHAGIAAAFETLSSSLDDVTHEPLECVAKGNLVLARVRMSARGKASGADIERVEGHLWEIRDGKVASLRWFNTPEEAAAAFADA